MASDRYFRKQRVGRCRVLQAMSPAASQARPVTTVAAEELKGMSDFSANIRRGAAFLKRRLMPIRQAEREDGAAMSTEQLIEGLVADLRPTSVTPRSALRIALAVSVMFVVALSTATLGPRADFGPPSQRPDFCSRSRLPAPLR